MNAKMQSGMAALEEWLQQEYVKYYDDSDNYSNKIELLDSKIPGGILLKNSSTKKYIVYDSKAYYLIDKR